MEIKYSNFELDKSIFEKYEIIGLIDINSNFIYNRIYDLKEVEYTENTKVNSFLRLESIKNRSLAKTLKNELYITKEIEKKKISELSSSDLIKVLLIKLCLSSCKVIVLEHIDSYLNDRDLKDIFIVLKKNKESIMKTIIYATNSSDKIVNNTTRYLITSEDRVIYSGDKLESLHEKTSIMKFVDSANKKGAKLEYYKDANDLLKAIYRSVKK